ncbi:hypothetical protein [Kutzneria sp. NPDC052558]|uniref:hypothetical protein n=1 Tax=Kutzneria sp. NPDC052558 TaxID=3364121 RepID=UPI0037C692DD
MTATLAVTAQSLVRFPELSTVEDGDEYVVGDPATGSFVSLPEIGVTAIKALSADQTVGEAAREVSEIAGEPVDLVEFVETLIESGLVDSVDGRSVRPRTQQFPRRWWTSVRPERARLLFGRTAWTVYLLAALWSAGALLALPDYRPAFEDFMFTPNPAVCLGISLVLGILLAMVHEYWHWLGARAEGVNARTTFSRRAFIVVMQTDLGLMWSLPRRRRLGPLAAGMAFDVTLLGVILALRVANGSGGFLSPLADRFLAALVLSQVLSIVFQCLICLRTDGYLLLSAALGCRNLLETTKLHVRSALVGLKPEQRRRLDDMPARDRQVARWYGPVYVVLMGFLAYVFVNFWLPGLFVVSGWVFYGVGGAPVFSAAFAQAAVPALITVSRFVSPVVIAIRERRRKRAVA